MMSENGFGYVEVKDGRVICYIGESNKPDVYIFENDEIVHAVKLQELVKERIKHQSEETCFGIPVDSGIRHELKSLVEESEK